MVNGIQIKPEEVTPEDIVALCQANPTAAMQLTNIVLSRKLKMAQQVIEIVTKRDTE